MGKLTINIFNANQTAHIVCQNWAYGARQLVFNHRVPKVDSAR
jgi:hypothetical protein